MFCFAGYFLVGSTGNDCATCMPTVVLSFRILAETAGPNPQLYNAKPRENRHTLGTHTSVRVQSVELSCCTFTILVNEHFWMLQTQTYFHKLLLLWGLGARSKLLHTGNSLSLSLFESDHYFCQCFFGLKKSKKNVCWFIKASN